MNATDLNPTELTHRPARRRPLILATLVSLAALVALAGCASATSAAAPVAPKIAVPASVPTKELAGLTLNVGDQKAGL